MLIESLSTLSGRRKRRPLSRQQLPWEEEGWIQVKLGSRVSATDEALETATNSFPPKAGIIQTHLNTLCS